MSLVTGLFDMIMTDNEKEIMCADEEELADIEYSLSYEQYLKISSAAKKRIDLVILEDGAHL